MGWRNGALIGYRPVWFRFTACKLLAFPRLVPKRNYFPSVHENINHVFPEVLSIWNEMRCAFHRNDETEELEVQVLARVCSHNPVIKCDVSSLFTEQTTVMWLRSKIVLLSEVLTSSNVSCIKSFHSSLLGEKLSYCEIKANIVCIITPWWF